MIILSLNLRGGGSRAKRKRIGFPNKKGYVDLCFIQETKPSGLDLNVVKEMWGDNNVEWSHLDANEASGGILTMWRKDFFSLNYNFRGEGFLGLCLVKEGKLIYFVNVYASCDQVSRLRTWNKILDFKNNNIGGSWCIGGDFNSTSSLDEKVGVSNRGYRNEIRTFNKFINDMDWVDLPTIGDKFTWFKSNGKSMSRLDRFLLSESFIHDWRVEGQHIGERDVSDHASIWLKDNRKDWGPKPFKFNNLWFKHEDFTTFVEVEWRKLEVKGIGDYCLVEKMKALKTRISWWKKTFYGWIDLKIDKDGKEMHDLDNLFVHFAGNVPEEVVMKRLKVAEDFWDNLNKKRRVIKAKVETTLASRGGRQHDILSQFLKR
ncbi:uncharacterized protein LOC131597438 [Vicia villosa]|uniref:uncharacterized protein LOC131597438 n=1 Tax=Vicia villosa TaxID=3911 RepID=UPI00273C35B2|nr:uncharacterized protein LOC131597438 [Vicia villosa]